MAMAKRLALLLVGLVGVATASPSVSDNVFSEAAQIKNPGQIEAVNDLLDRVIPGSKDQFVFTISSDDCAVGVKPPCFKLEDNGAKIAITATSVSEVTLGLGHYLREYCHMTIGWRRGGGRNVFVPKTWPSIGNTPVAMRRSTPWSYIMNVCTHSYSLVWYSWADWEEFIDWMALSGINLFLAMTGQEEVQYKVFQQFGLKDEDIRGWFNGPAFLTWSRGQNEYGNDIAGMLPRSWMQQQWNMQKQIIQRYRSLGMSAQLPGFQGNVPIQLKEIHKDANITKQGDTGWMTSTDPLYGQIADVWMKTLIEDFGTDHWYQLDGYFNGGTAPWMEDDVTTAVPTCTWSALETDTYVVGCAENCKSFPTVDEAKSACIADNSCGGITANAKQSSWQLRAGGTGKSPTNESSYVISNLNDCRAIETDPVWKARGLAAYTGLNRTDPDAIWSFQGWAFIGWNTNKQAGNLKSFIDITPPGKFNVIDMSTNGDGEWKKWNNASFWGAYFVWTTLHDFGGTDGLKGDLGRINDIPFGALSPEIEKDTGVWGTGYTPEGIDQNPVYYEFMMEANYRAKKVDNITNHIIARSLKRYGLNAPNDDVTTIWSLLVESAYAQDLSVQDGTGVPHLGGHESWPWNNDRHTPTPTMCNIYTAWTKLIDLSASVDASLEPFRYDLVNTGREVLAQLAGPSGQNFTDAIGKPKMDAGEVKATGSYYAQVLFDVDTLVATDTAFQLGPWIEMAKYFAQNNTDCEDAGSDYPTIKSCAAFYEWNARVQLTTWNPTPQHASAIPGGPIDYASKHWSGLIRDYYGKRVQLVMGQALVDAAAGNPLNTKAVDAIKAKHAYDWTTATDPYPTSPVGDAVKVSKAMHAKYASYFTTC